MADLNQKPLIVVDSCADMPKEYYEKNNISVVSLHYNIEGGETLADVGDVEATKALYSQMREGKMCVTTQVNVYAFKELFTKLLAEKRPIFYLGFSSGLSGTYNSGRIAAEEVMAEHPEAKIVVVDSLAASMGEGLMLNFVVDLINNGKTAEEVAAWVEENKLRLNHWFTVDDLNHLKRGGRVGAVSAFMGTMLSIKPVLWVDPEGLLKPVSKERGRKKAINTLYDKYAELVENPEGQSVYISHGDCYDEAMTLKTKIEANFPVKEVVLNCIGPVVGTHAGPGTIALFFFGKPRG